MYRLTTPTHKFMLGMDPREWEKFVLSYSQHDKIILEKTETDAHDVEVLSEEGPFALTVQLTQEETALFSPNDNAYAQIRCKYNNGTCFVSEKMMFKVEDPINKTVI